PSLDEQRKIDFGKLERRLQVLYPNSKVYLVPLSRKIIVRGQARDPEEAARIMQVVRDELINQQGDLFLGGYYNNFATVGTTAFNDFLSGFVVNELQVPGEYQVSLRVRIAELSRSQARSYGLDWSAAINDARHVVTQSFAAATPMLTGIFENGDISIALEALASNGSAKILSDATMVTLSGEPASFLAGGEFAVPSTVGLSGVGVATTTFRGFGTSLIATPTVVNHDLIRMTIIPELSEINGDTTVGGIPGVNVKRVQTRVELREGQTIVLGGLFERQQRADVTRIPWLGEIPVVGTYLFNRKTASEDEMELLILVTPEIVRPMDAEEVPPMPGFYVTHPNDWDFCKYNRIEGNPDLGHYQLLPYGNGQGYAQDMGYNFYNAPPADGQIYPAPAGQWGPQGGYGGYSQAPAMGPATSAPQQQYPTHAAPGYQQPPYAPGAVPESAVEPRGVEPPPQLTPPAPGPQSSRLSRPSRSIQQTSGEAPQSDSQRRQGVIDRFRRR
ncbi:MAG: type II and III secretion system protein, partial [Planctomycetaceae bacterium]|nr:type II and III secretion system protein [Planctomycetaceae bacterium]